jgi:hypothetical protein
MVAPHRSQTGNDNGKLGGTGEHGVASIVSGALNAKNIPLVQPPGDYLHSADNPVIFPSRQIDCGKSKVVLFSPFNGMLLVFKMSFRSIDGIDTLPLIAMWQALQRFGVLDEGRARERRFT